jgi:hypothetical protein
LLINENVIGRDLVNLTVTLPVMPKDEQAASRFVMVRMTARGYTGNGWLTVSKQLRPGRPEST